MITCRQCRHLFVESLYGELPSETQAAFKTHLQQCRGCFREYRQLSATLRLMEKRSQPQPEADFWEGYWDRVAEKLDREEVSSAEEGSSGSVKKNLRFDHPWIYQIGAAAAILVIGIFIGKLFLKEASVGPPQAGLPADETAVTIQQTEASQQARLYLEKSKVLLLGLVNLEPEFAEPAGVDFPRQQRLSRQLIREAGTLKTALNAPNQQRLKELIIDLEVILLQIANLELKNGYTAIELIKDGVDRKGIMLKINLEEIRQNVQGLQSNTIIDKPSI